MRIRDFFIDGFGIFAEQQVSNLSKGVTVFLGNNEAGKSTCLGFFRAMLFGFPTKNAKDEFQYPPLRGGSEGGNLLLDTNANGLVRLERRPGTHGGKLFLSTPDGTPLDNALLDSMLSGATRELFKSVYGFSLSELQDAGTLREDKVRHALYGAAFGTSTRPIGQVLSTLEGDIAEIYASRGQKPLLNKAIKKLTELQAELRKATNTVEEYDALMLAKTDAQNELSALRESIKTHRAQRSNIGRIINQWEQWTKLTELETLRGNISPVVEEFPENGVFRLEALKQREHTLNRSRKEHQEQLARIQQQLDSLAPSPQHAALLACATDIQSQIEGKTAYQQLCRTINDASLQLTRQQEELQAELLQLGSDWTLERLLALDTNMFTEARIEQFSQSMSEAASEHSLARAALEGQQKEYDNATHAAQSAEELLANLASPADVYDPIVLDTLEKEQKHIGSLLSECDRAKRQLEQEQEQLATDTKAIVSHWTTEQLDSADTSTEIRQSIRQHQLTIQERLNTHNSALANLQAAQQAYDEAELHLQTCKAEQNRIAQPVSKDAVQEQRSNLNTFRKALSTKATAAAELAAAQNSDAGSGARTIGIITAACGSLLLAGDAADVLTSLSTAIAEVLPTMAHMPLLTGLGGILLTAGAVLFLAGMFQKRKIVEAAGITLATAQEEALASAALTGADSADDDGFSFAMLQLDRTKERLANQDFITRKIIEADNALSRTKARIEKAVRDKDITYNALQAAKQAWQVYAQQCNLSATSTPEDAISIFDRIEGLKDRSRALQKQQETLALKQQEIDSYEEMAKTLPPLADLTTQEELHTAINELLYAAKQAKATEDERAKAAQRLEESKKQLSRHQAILTQASDRLAAAEATQKSIMQQWYAWLAEQKLPEMPGPDTARKALGHITQALRLHKQCEHASKQLATLQVDTSRFEAQQDSLLQKLEFPARYTESGNTSSIDRLATTDALRSAFEAAQSIETAKQTLLAKQAPLQTTESGILQEQNALTEELATLLQAGGTNDQETFRTRGAAYEERKKLTAEIETLRAALAAANADAHTDDQQENTQTREELEEQAQQLDTLLRDAEEQENAFLSTISDANSKLQLLASADDIATMRAQESAIKEEIRTHALIWAKHRLTHHLISEAKATFERERQPDVIRNAGSFLATITNNTYKTLHIALDGDKDNLRAVTSKGEIRKPEELSRGTAEQLYLALRLGYILGHSAQAEPLPVIMDDILVNFDPTRATHTAKALGQLAEHNQILYFTCHPNVADTLCSTIPDASLYQVSDGTFTRA